MTAAARPETHGRPPFEVKLEVERLDLLFRQNVQGLIALVAFGGSYLFVSWGDRPAAFLWLWGGLVYASALLRVVATLAWNRARSRITRIADTDPWRRTVKVLLFVSGLSWGILGFMLPSGSHLQQMITVTVVVLMSAGSVVAYSSSMTAMCAVILPSLGLWAAGLLLTGEPFYELMGSMVIMYMVLGVVAGRNLNRFVIQALRLSVVNAGLAEDLRRQVEIKDRAQIELQESQDRLRLALDSSGAATWDWDLQSSVFTCEGNLPQVLGISAPAYRGSLDDYLGFLHAGDRDRFRAAMEQAVSGDVSVDIEVRTVWPDGRERLIAHHGRVKGVTGSSSAHVSGICWDVTDRKAQERHRRDRERVEAANRAKSVFLANASHEIRTPLSAITGYADLLLSNPAVTADVRSDLQMIARHGKYLVSLVNDLLDLSKIETGQIYIQKSRMRVIDEIRDTVLLIKPLAEKKGLALEVVYETSVPEFIETDSTRFREILINILSNAVKFTPQGTVRMIVSHPETDSDRLHIRVIDTGIGVSTDVRRNLFQPFVRGQSEFVQKVQGSGLGLALSRNLAVLLGGDVALTASTENKGSEFLITLAVGDVQDSSRLRPGAERLADPRPSAHVGRLRGRRILIVDDAADLRVLVRRLLEKEGAMVDECENGAEAVAQAFRKDYDVLLMDIKMPVLDGYNATTALRKMGFTRPIIALTAHASTHDKTLCLAAGCSAYLSKPVDFGHLIESVLGQLQAGADFTARVP